MSGITASVKRRLPGSGRHVEAAASAVTAGSALTAAAVTHYTASARRETAARLLAEGARRELYAAGPGSEHQLAWAR
ncbi:hypothetical protein, partial [Streptomyces cahuitamycinicus]|uniref:hypothetical protein n=1 Tax=Streptomyces cahuitamycinicus TaxID=2070367 RepID=UPI0015E085CC